MPPIFWIIKELRDFHFGGVISLQSQVFFLDKIICEIDDRKELGQHLEALRMLNALMKYWVQHSVCMVIVKALN
jgi:hypothetical protein